MKKKSNLLLKFFAVSLVCFLVQGGIYHFAGAEKLIKGWLWGGSSSTDMGVPFFGWASVSKQNCDSDNDGFQDACPGAPAPSFEYQLKIPDADGDVLGYAWSENFGWIDFGPLGPYPAEPDQSAYREGDFLKGWARILSVENEIPKLNSGGWEGWIKLSGTNYGVNLADPSNSYAWSNELGWIDFEQISNNFMPAAVALFANPNSFTLSSGESVSRETDLTWAVSGVLSSCTATSSNGAWTGPKAVTGGTDTAVTVDASPVIFTIDCLDEVGNSVSSQVYVNSYCNKRVCGSGGTCSSSTELLLGDTCPATDECSIDEDCAKKSLEFRDWWEVVP